MTQPQLDAVRQQVSPGEPHEYHFAFGPDGTPAAGEDYVLRRPTRGMTREIMRYLASLLSAAGTGAEDLLNTLDGGMIEAEAFLRTCLVRAPAQWYKPVMTGGDGRPVCGPDGKPVRYLAADDIYEDELRRVWQEAQRYLSRFSEYHDRWPDTTTPKPPDGPPVGG